MTLAGTEAAAQSVQVVAHQDDDVLFMNPDLRNSLQAGSPSTTVYMTAGEASGAPGLTREQHAANRQEASRAAYASMLGVYQDSTDITVPPGTDFPKYIDSFWTRSICKINGAIVEVDQLKAAPQVQLVFLNIPDDGDDYIDPAHSMVYLRSGSSGPLVSTIAPENWPTESCVWPEYAVDPAQVPQPVPDYFPHVVEDGGTVVEVVQVLPDVYDHDRVAGVLRNIVQRVGPAIVRTLDPYPVERACDPNDTTTVTCYPKPTDAEPLLNPQYTGYYERYDNLDHRMAAQFVREVLSGYSGHRATLNYMGYPSADRTGNLSDIEFGLVKQTSDTYGHYDANYELTFAAVAGGWYPSWFGAMYERNPSNATWLKRFRDGRLAAFGVKADRVTLWYEVCPGGGSWYGPIPLGNDSSIYGPVAPAIAVGQRLNGLLQLFFLRTPQAPQQGTPQLCTVAQSASADSFGAERCLGAPSPTTPNWTSAPAVATGADGAFWVFAKNDRGGVSANHELDLGVWSGWTDLPGDPATGEPAGGAPDVIEGLVATQDALGRVHVFAQTRFGVIHQWFQQAANGPWVFVPVFPSNSPVYLTHGLGVAMNADGRLEVFYRGSGRPDRPECGDFGCNAQVFSVREQSVGGPWGAETDLFGDAGHGPLAVVRHPSGPLQVFELNYYGGVSEISETSPSGSFYPFQWQDLRGHIVHYPSAAIDAAGRTAVAAFGLDGKLYLRRQQSSAASASFSNWALVEQGLLPGSSQRNICVAPRK